MVASFLKETKIILFMGVLRDICSDFLIILSNLAFGWNVSAHRSLLPRMFASCGALLLCFNRRIFDYEGFI